MDSESSQDAYFCFKEGEKDLMAYEEEEMLVFEESVDSTVDDQCEGIQPKSNAATTKEHNFSILMSAIDCSSLRGHSLSGDEPDEEVIVPVCASTPQPQQLKGMDNFEPPGVDSVVENGSALSLSGISMPSPKVTLSQACDFVGDSEEGTAMSPCRIPDVEMVSGSLNDGDLESGDNTNALQQRYEVHNEPPHPTKKLWPEVGHQLRLFHNEQIMVQTLSIWEINDMVEQTNQENFIFNGIDIAGQLLEAAAAQMEPNVIVNESTLMAIANGLQLSIECGSGGNNPMIVHRGIGPIVAGILLDSQTGIVMGFAVSRLVPHPIINSSGSVQGSVIHQVTRGFAIDDNSRRIITDGVGSAICVMKQSSPSDE